VEEIDIGNGLIWFVAFLFSTTVHEAMHAFAAWRLGDSTAYHGGQVSLNPIPHIEREPIGMVVLPLLTSLTQGWAIGWASCPYDPIWARRYPGRSALMAAAGPLGRHPERIGAGASCRNADGLPGELDDVDARPRDRVEDIPVRQPSAVLGGAPVRPSLRVVLLIQCLRSFESKRLTSSISSKPGRTNARAFGTARSRLRCMRLISDRKGATSDSE
jgi:hypothetical protein